MTPIRRIFMILSIVSLFVITFVLLLSYQPSGHLTPVSAPLLEESPLPTPEPTPITEPTSAPTPVTESMSFEAKQAIDFVAEHEKIPLDELEVIGEEVREFSLLERHYVVVTLLSNQPGMLRQFQVLVDPTTGEVDPDIVSVLEAEQNVRQARYGKFDSALYELLQTSEESDLIPVAIWAAQPDGEDWIAAAEAEISQIYPEGIEVEDPDLQVEIRRQYAERLEAHISRSTDPIVTWLESRGYTVKKLFGTPVVTASLSKQDILELAKLPQVGSIQWGGGEAAPSSDISIPTSRIPMVWQRGIIGSNVRIGIVERGRINDTARSCLNVVSTRAGSWGDDTFIKAGSRPSQPVIAQHCQASHVTLVRLTPVLDCLTPVMHILGVW